MLYYAMLYTLYYINCFSRCICQGAEFWEVYENNQSLMVGARWADLSVSETNLLGISHTIVTEFTQIGAKNKNIQWAEGIVDERGQRRAVTSAWLVGVDRKSTVTTDNHSLQPWWVENQLMVHNSLNLDGGWWNTSSTSQEY